MAINRTNESHNGFELDINFLTSKSLEFKKSFAFMLIVKKQHKNSVVYDYSEKKLSKKTGISEYLVKKHVKRLISLGYCQYNGKNISFIGLDKIMPYRSKGGVICVEEKSNIENVLEKINILIVKNNFSKQDRLRKIKDDLIKSKTKGAKINIKSYKKSRKYADLNPKVKDEKLIDFNIIGMRKLSVLLGCSLDYAASFIKNLVRKKIISIKQIINKYADFEFRQFSSDELKKAINKKSGYFFCFNGSTYHHLGTEIKFK